ncbi:AAA family ATPase [uncultured Microscilla sp.]|uniref:AAA family ATPase n=1 Tax=uncultured Microscilla sp. TaxID=432653 RepID=UPI0026274B81|nr:AAA family ATPase [uncultured Microscilla sp.]
MKNNSYIYYGTKCNTEELINFVKHTLTTNEIAENSGRLKTPICIWGEHGIGKTQTVENFAKANGYKFTYIAPAQFEEMGDLLGMPAINTNNSSEKDNSTVFIPPDWVPREEGPGILLIDDVNRADDRILRGIMQLLQNYELVSWKLPEKWHIILTANPDGGDYSVTPMDFAMLTRMMHITLTFDVKKWALWAEQNGVDPRGISFVLTYPEAVTGERTTPRTLVQFFENISPLKDLKKELGLVKMLADACLDSNTVTSFMAFLNNDLSKLITPEEIINTKSFEKEVYQKIKGLVDQKTKRVDILSVICTRLINYLTIAEAKFKQGQIDNIKKFLKMDFLPNDMRLIAAQDLVSSSNPSLKSIMADPEIGQLLLKKM